MKEGFATRKWVSHFPVEGSGRKEALAKEKAIKGKANEKIVFFCDESHG